MAGENHVGDGETVLVTHSFHGYPLTHPIPVPPPRPPRPEPSDFFRLSPRDCTRRRHRLRVPRCTDPLVAESEHDPQVRTGAGGRVAGASPARASPASAFGQRSVDRDSSFAPSSGELFSSPAISLHTIPRASMTPPPHVSPRPRMLGEDAGQAGGIRGRVSRSRVAGHREGWRVPWAATGDTRQLGCTPGNEVSVRERGRLIPPGILNTWRD